MSQLTPTGGHQIDTWSAKSADVARRRALRLYWLLVLSPHVVFGCCLGTLATVLEAGVVVAIVTTSCTLFLFNMPEIFNWLFEAGDSSVAWWRDLKERAGKD